MFCESHNIVNKPAAFFPSFSMRISNRIGLWLILSGLLFSPAEGICLLPFPSDDRGNLERESNLRSGAQRYQESICRAEKGRKKSTYRSAKDVFPLAVGQSPAAPVDALFGPAGSVIGYHHLHFYKSEGLQHQLNIRPPPSALNLNAL